MRHFPGRLTFALLIFTLNLVACGMRGPLYLPEDQPQNAPAAKEKPIDKERH